MEPNPQANRGTTDDYVPITSPFDGRLPRTLDNMAARGGGFASRLAEAWQRADGDNSRRLLEAFPHLVRDYMPPEDRLGPPDLI